MGGDTSAGSVSCADKEYLRDDYRDETSSISHHGEKYGFLLMMNLGYYGRFCFQEQFFVERVSTVTDIFSSCCF